MAASMGSDDDDGIVGINVTPLVDIMLVLLIIFMVASSYIVKESIEVDLPKAATGGEVMGTTLTFILQADGALFLDGEPTTQEQIAARCRRAAAEDTEDKKAQAIISADKAVSHGEVVALIDLVRQNGVLSFAINIDPAPPSDSNSGSLSEKPIAPTPAPPKGEAKEGG